MVIQVTKSSIRDVYFDEARQDYFYRDDDNRVPDTLREGYQTTVFKRSSSTKSNPYTQEEVKHRNAKLQASRQRFLKRIGRA